MTKVWSEKQFEKGRNYRKGELTFEEKETANNLSKSRVS